MTLCQLETFNDVIEIRLENVFQDNLLQCIKWAWFDISGIRVIPRFGSYRIYSNVLDEAATHAESCKFWISF